MSSVVISGDTSGAITLSAPAIAGTNTLTLPANTGTVITTASSGGVSQAMLATGVAGTGPAFSAYLADNQSISANTFTKVLFDTEEFDTNNNFASSRFTPTVAGYYQVNLMLYISAAGSGQGNGAIYKNGVVTKAQFLQVSVNQILSVPALVYLNGSSDYIEAYAYSVTAGVVAGGGNSNYCYFQAYLARAA
jgi:hypothetical protein